jgi:hypothetical protein
VDKPTTVLDSDINKLPGNKDICNPLKVELKPRYRPRNKFCQKKY